MVDCVCIVYVLIPAVYARLRRATVHATEFACASRNLGPEYRRVVSATIYIAEAR